MRHVNQASEAIQDFKSAVAVLEKYRSNSEELHALVYASAARVKAYSGSDVCDLVEETIFVLECTGHLRPLA